MYLRIINLKPPFPEILMKEKSVSAHLVFYNLRTSMRTDFGREYRFVRVFLRHGTRRAPRAYRCVSRLERPYEIQEYGEAAVSVSRSSTMSPQPVGAPSLCSLTVAWIASSLCVSWFFPSGPVVRFQRAAMLVSCYWEEHRKLHRRNKIDDAGGLTRRWQCAHGHPRVDRIARGTSKNVRATPANLVMKRQETVHTQRNTYFSFSYERY